MPKVESWRLEELAMLVEDLTAVLKAGFQPEWAGVFSHFSHELTLVRAAQTLDPAELRRLVRNIRLCFEGNSGFPALYLEGRETGEGAALNARLIELRAKLTRALKEISQRLVELIN